MTSKKRPNLPQPTAAELELLRVLWKLGPSTVREVHSTLERAKPAGYTTVLKMLQIMTDKGLVHRDERQRSHVYHPTLSEQDTQRTLVDDLMERAFGGSAESLVLRALESKHVSQEELTRIVRLIESQEEKGHGNV
ncbi:MAG: BlaI/MecI/CopY family transcriptional regulator [Candidatus Hydrogenedentales bacterium]|jgi:predicted transcriptional regulator